LRKLFKYSIIGFVLSLFITVPGFCKENDNKNKDQKLKNLASILTYLSGDASLVDSNSTSFNRKNQYGGGFGVNALFDIRRLLIGMGTEITYTFKSDTNYNYYYESYYAIELFLNTGFKIINTRPKLSLLGGGGIKHMNSRYSSSIVPDLRAEILLIPFSRKGMGFSLFYVHTFHPDFMVFETVGFKVVKTWEKKN